MPFSYFTPDIYTESIMAQYSLECTSQQILQGEWHVRERGRKFENAYATRKGKWRIGRRLRRLLFLGLHNARPTRVSFCSFLECNRLRSE